MSAVKENIDRLKLPRHVAVIMDGNGRWAKSRGQARVFGHRNGVKAVREITEAAAEIGISFLTLYAFSTENWSRPAFEVSALMRLLVETIHSEIKTLQKNSIRLHAIGDLSKLPKQTADSLDRAIQETKSNDRMTLTLCLNYSGRWDIAHAARKIAEAGQKGELDVGQIDEDIFAQYMSTAILPDPELLIRTSGEQRLSNFLLWECAYTEFYFTDTLWPDMRKEDLYEALIQFQQRERRFGKTSEQLS